MNSPTSEVQTTLLTSHKGVDLHAASAQLVMKDRLEGGHRLVNLIRCELHTFWDNSAPGGMEKLLNTELLLCLHGKDWNLKRRLKVIALL